MNSKLSLKKSIGKISVIITTIVLMTKALGYLEKIIIAYYWGTDYRADAYYAVVTIAVSVSLLFREITEPGLLNILLKSEKQNGITESNKAYVTIFRTISLVALAICSIQILFPSLVSGVFLSGFMGERLMLANQLFRVVGLGIFVMIITTITNTYLLSGKQFVTIAISEFVYKLVVILFLFMLAGTKGVIVATGSIIIGAAVKFSIQWLKIKKLYAPSYTAVDKKYIRQLLLISWPLLIGNIFSQIGTIAHNNFASYMADGTLSALAYAKKIIDLPVVLFPYTLSVIVFPYFATMSIEKDTLKMQDLLNDSLKYILLFFIPLTIFTANFPEDIIRVIFERGAFDAQSTSLTSSALRIYNLGMIAFALETILVIYLLANARIKLPVIIGIVCVLVDVIITFMLIKPLGYTGIAWGYIISRWIKVLLLVYVLWGDLRLRAASRSSVLLPLIFSLVLFAIMIYCSNMYILPQVQGVFATLVLLVVTALIAFGGYFYILNKFRLISFKL